MKYNVVYEMIYMLYINLLLSANELEGSIAPNIGQTLRILKNIESKSMFTLCQTYGVA